MTYLEVDDDQDGDYGGDQLRNIRRVLAIEGLLKGVDFVLLGAQEVEQSNDGTLELGSLLRADRDGRE